MALAVLNLVWGSSQTPTGSMVNRIAFISTLFCIGLGLMPGIALGQDSSGWAQGLHSRARLVSGDNTGGQRLAGLEIALDSGFKTYWRNPGESGLPPRFDWSGSRNVKAVDVRWPAPSRLEDAAGVSYVYLGAVLLPLLVEPEDPTKPVHIALSVEYGICKDICIPARAELTRDLGTPPSSQAEIETVLRTKVPRKLDVGAAGELAIRALEAGSPDAKSFTALVTAPAGTSPQLFIDAPDGWYFSTSAPDAGNRVAVTLDEKPAGPDVPVTITLTLVAGEKSIESTVGLDANGKPR